MKNSRSDTRPVKPPTPKRKRKKPPLTPARKAELFDYLVSRADTIRLHLNFGGNHDIYHEQGSEHSLERDITEAQGFENDDDE